MIQMVVEFVNNLIRAVFVIFQCIYFYLLLLLLLLLLLFCCVRMCKIMCATTFSYLIKL